MMRSKRIFRPWSFFSVMGISVLALAPLPAALGEVTGEAAVSIPPGADGERALSEPGRLSDFEGIFPPPATGDLPPAARAALDQYAQAEQAALRELAQAADRIASTDAAGAAALRARIRQLRSSTGARSPQADPGTLRDFRDRVGQTLTFEVVGATQGAIWGGPKVYTDDTVLAVAAVHAGLVEPGQRAVVRVELLPGRPEYTGSTRHGVTSASYGAWQGSYRLRPGPRKNKGGGPVRSRGAADQPLALPTAQADPGTLTAYRDRVGQSFTFEVTGATTGAVWGTEVYTDDSALATAAVHAGAVRAGERGVVRVTIRTGCPSYRGSTLNGVTTRDYGGWSGSYLVELPRP